MKRFEHDYFTARRDDKSILKRMGDQGWELVSVIPISWMDGEVGLSTSSVSEYEYFFKREVE